MICMATAVLSRALPCRAQCLAGGSPGLPCPAGVPSDCPFISQDCIVAHDRSDAQRDMKNQPRTSKPASRGVMPLLRQASNLG